MATRAYHLFQWIATVMSSLEFCSVFLLEQCWPKSPLHLLMPAPRRCTSWWPWPRTGATWRMPAECRSTKTSSPRRSKSCTTSTPRAPKNASTPTHKVEREEARETARFKTTKKTRKKHRFTHTWRAHSLTYSSTDTKQNLYDKHTRKPRHE